MRSTEMFQTVPSFALAILLVAIYAPSTLSIMIAISVVSWPPVARLARAEFLSMRRREFVQAALLSGQSSLRVAWSQILPNILSSLTVMAALMVSMAILFESALSFVGLGDPKVVSWGYLISAGRGVSRRAVLIPARTCDHVDVRLDHDLGDGLATPGSVFRRRINDAWLVLDVREMSKAGQQVTPIVEIVSFSVEAGRRFACR